MGIVGLGRIGGHVAGYAIGFGMKVLAYDPYQSGARFDELGVERCDIASLLKASDIVTLHANLRDDNYNLISDKEINLMRTGAYLINTARGLLLDEHATANALRSGRLSGVAVDVLADEHTDTSWSDSPLISAARDGFNVIITPHIGGCTNDAMHITEESLAEYVASVMETTS
jgi:D-3-phosphoglycerate dehydrogenase